MNPDSKTPSKRPRRLSADQRPRGARPRCAGPSPASDRRQRQETEASLDSRPQVPRMPASAHRSQPDESHRPRHWMWPASNPSELGKPRLLLTDHSVSLLLNRRERRANFSSFEDLQRCLNRWQEQITNHHKGADR